MSLPVLTTADDVTDLVAYLKTKPTGATITEAKAAIKKSVLDGRKLTAYTLWGFVTKDGERLKLTQRGWDYARKPEQEQEIFRRVIDSIPPYKSVLEWAFHQKLESMTNVDVAAHWHEHHTEALGTDNADTIKNTAVCFFHIAQAAGVGTLKIGRAGHTTRLILDRTISRSSSKRVRAPLHGLQLPTKPSLKLKQKRPRLQLRRQQPEPPSSFRKFQFFPPRRDRKWWKFASSFPMEVTWASWSRFKRCWESLTFRVKSR
jgi:hypothetical protein